MSAEMKFKTTAGGSVTLTFDDTETGDVSVEIPKGGFLGHGQTWQDVNVSRAVGTLYTNNTGKPIVLNLYGYILNLTLTTLVFVEVDGLEVARGYIYANETVGKTLHLDGIIVPDGSTYKVVNTDGNFNKVVWTELRS